MRIKRVFPRSVIGFFAVLPFLLFSSSALQAAVYFNHPQVRLSWSPSQEGDTKGYEVYRATSLSGPFTKVSVNIIEVSTWTDSNVTDGGAYYYRLKAVDTCGNVSDLSAASDAAVVDLSAPLVSAEPSGGTYSRLISVALQANEPSTIYYTTNGSTPTTSSTVYSAPITLLKSTVLKYFAVDRALNGSPVATDTYTLNIDPNDMDDDGYASDIDCDDSDPLVNPGAEEICGDFIDNDCDEQVDEGCNDFSPPAYIDDSTFPFPGNGIDDNVLIPPDSSIRLRLVDGSGLDIRQELCRTSITASAVYVVGGEEIFEPLIGETRFKEIDRDDCTDAWVVFVPDFQHAYGNGLPAGLTIQVIVDASDVFGNDVAFFEDGSFRFRIAEDGRLPLLPLQAFEDPNPSADGDLIKVTLLEGPDAGVFMLYPDTLVPAPYFGSRNTIPALPGGVSVLFDEPVNLQPPCVFFDDEFSLFIPLPDGIAPASSRIWRFDPATGWEAATVGDGWLVNRIDHASYPDPTGPPTIELVISHFTGVQIAAAQADSGGGGSGGGGGGCFIATAAFGSAMEKDVVILRKFRDTYLLPNRLGKELVQVYYRTSPGIARVIARHDTLRAMTRTALMPVVWGCKLTLEAPAVASGLLIVTIAGIIFAVFLGFRIRRIKLHRSVAGSGN